MKQETIETDIIQLQTHSITVEQHNNTCSNCPAFQDVTGSTRDGIFCTLHNSLLAGIFHESARIARQVRNKFGGDHYCQPMTGGNNAHYFETLMRGHES